MAQHQQKSISPVEEQHDRVPLRPIKIKTTSGWYRCAYSGKNTAGGGSELYEQHALVGGKLKCQSIHG
jgi:hypothetical protein